MHSIFSLKAHLKAQLLNYINVLISPKPSHAKENLFKTKNPEKKSF